MIAIALAITLNAAPTRHICIAYPLFIKMQNDQIKNEDTNDTRRSQTTLRVIELAFDDCYNNSSKKKQKWYREQYFKAWENNQKITNKMQGVGK